MLHKEIVSINPAKDDIENEIAGALACPLKFENNESSVYIDFTLKLNYTNTNNVPVTFLSSDDTIAKVSNTGDVTGIFEGVVTSTIYNATNHRIQDSITVTFKKSPLLVQ